MPMYSQGSDDWLRERATVITATECSALEGLNPWTKPMEVVRQKVRALAAAPSGILLLPKIVDPSKAKDRAKGMALVHHQDRKIFFVASRLQTPSLVQSSSKLLLHHQRKSLVFCGGLMAPATMEPSPLRWINTD